jgi:predicted O-methyltransferase YrrM
MARVPGIGRAARALVRIAPLRVPLADALADVDPKALIEALGPRLNREVSLDRMPVDLEPEGRLGFEDLAGLFASSNLSHGIVGMPIRQLAYVFGLARRTGARRAIEIGRWRGGSTIALAAAMGPEGRVWSIDLGDKAERVLGMHPDELDRQTAAFAERFGLQVELIRGDSRTVEVETGEVDLVLIDGDHASEVVRSDVERFGRRVRLGGAVLLDDAFGDGVYLSVDPRVRRVVHEVLAGGDFRLVRVVERLAHLERVC